METMTREGRGGKGGKILAFKSYLKDACSSIICTLFCLLLVFGNDIDLSIFRNKDFLWMQKLT